MTAEEKGGSSSGEDGVTDKFPIGTRVLAVDDDPTCLKILEKFLRECQHEVFISRIQFAVENSWTLFITSDCFFVFWLISYSNQSGYHSTENVAGKQKQF